MRRTHAPALVLAAISLAASSLSAQLSGTLADGDLGRRVASVIDASPVNQAHWGLLVVDLETGDTLLSRNHFRKFIPASNMKILVTSAALWELGPDHRFRTEVFAAGEREGDVLVGDLVVRPSGDPTWSDRWYEDAADLPLRDLARQVAATGIRTVSGDVVIAASRWDSTSVQGSWMTFNVPWGFSAGPGPFALAEGTTSIVVRGGAAAGDVARVEWTPRAAAGFVEGEVRTVARSDTTANVQVQWLPERGVHRISGTIRSGRTDTIEVATRSSVAEARTRFVELLGAEGVTLLQLPSPRFETAEGRGDAASGDSSPRSVVGQDPEVVPVPGIRNRPRTPVVWAAADTLPLACDPDVVAWCDLADPIAVRESAPLIEIAKNALEPSQNWITEQLLWSLAAETRGRASWEDGTTKIREVLAARAGVDTLDLALQDGSGLSAYNLITPRAVVSILTAMDRSEMSDAWRDALAAPGEEDSTLENRLAGLEGRLQGKTGTISNVNSLSGYLFTDDGRRLVFSILTNGSGLESAVMRRAIDGVARELAKPLGGAGTGG